MSKQWFKSGYLRSAPSGEINREAGIIEGVSVCTAGEAKGHGVSLDSEFIDDVTRMGNDLKSGVKVRFGHPNMCSQALGTFVGRMKNFRKVGDVSKADLFLSNTAKEAPNGNLYEYVLNMAENEPDMFGTSIAFTPGPQYRRDEEGGKQYRYTEDGELNEGYDNAPGPEYAEIESLHACDIVDEPAANSGLFSGETAAGQITDFFNQFPDVLNELSENPDVLDALTTHADKAKEFIARFQEYSKQCPTQPPKQENQMPEENQEPDESATTTSTDESTEESTSSQPAEPASETEPAIDPESTESEEENNETENDSELSAIRSMKEFGAEITAKAFDNGGGYEEARELHYEAIKKENEQLKKKADVDSEGEKPGEFSGEPQKKKSLWEKK